MMDLSILISKLLFTHNRVVVPGLGIFRTEMQEAYHHPVSHEFAPKYKKLSFIKDEKLQDDLLLNHLGSDEGEKQLKDYVSWVNQELKANGSCGLKNIGVLKLHASGNILFEQDKNFNYEKAFFGLESFSQKPIQPQKKLDKKQDAKSVKQDAKKTSVWPWILVGGIAAALTLGLFFYQDQLFPSDSELAAQSGPQVQDEVPQPDKAAIQDTAEKETVAVIDTLAVEVEKEDSVQEVVVEEVIEEVGIVEANDLKYFVIAGCFRSEVKAKEYLRELKAKGYSEASIEGKTSGGLTRVCYKGFEKRNQADSYMEAVSKKEGQGLWVQKITD